jgi:hypothetical protein
LNDQSIKALKNKRGKHSTKRHRLIEKKTITKQNKTKPKEEIIKNLNRFCFRQLIIEIFEITLLIRKDRIHSTQFCNSRTIMKIAKEIITY